jgi:succinate-semialdehyde dehydrogenase / glutarate-semialdehyde dehydrogenase
MSTRKDPQAMAYKSINPFDGSTLKRFDAHSDAELSNALATAHTCFQSWRHTGFAERAAIVVRAAELLRAHSDRFAQLMTQEMGKRIVEARGEVLLSADILAYQALHAEEQLAPQPLQPAQGQAHIENSALGVLLGVQPWNFPYYQLARFAAPNLMAGNVVMVKHAASVPQCAEAFGQLWLDAGAPEGAYTNLRISHQQVNQIIDDPRIRGVALTGSLEAGREVAARAGQAMKKSTMELGGNDAFIVLEDADIDQAVHWAVWAKMNNMGQCCVAAKRFIVVESVAARFLDKFQTALAQFISGDPMKPETTLAPLSSEAALQTLLDQVTRSVAHGARVVMGGQRLPRSGAFMAPTILDQIKPDNPAYREELFGPVALFFAVKHESEALSLANDSDFGLGASIFTRDVARAQRLASRIDSGMVFINHPTWTAPGLPFGGVKHSGYGRELAGLGIHEFVNKKLVRVSALDDPA